MRWGPGPVFIYECLVTSRRWQTYALRAAGVAALLCAMATIASSTETTPQSWRDYAELGEGYFFALIGVELALVLLAAPAATAGAICLERARGTLAHVLMTDLSDPEIVLGKLAARLLPVLGLVACTWPVMAICSLLGGIDPITLTLAFAIIVAVAVLGCSTALLISVWAEKAYEVVLATYVLFILGGLLWPMWYALAMAGWVAPVPDRTLLANPFYVAFAPYADPGKLEFWDYLAFFATTVGASGLFTAIAVWRVRPVARRGPMEKTTSPRHGLIGRVSRWLPGPSLDGNPTLWREWHRSRPTPWMAATSALLMGSTFVLCVVGAAALWTYGASNRSPRTWQFVCECAAILHVVFGLLMVAAIAPTSMAEERQRGSLDLLAATTLSTRAIVTGKWLATFRLVWPMTIGPGLVALAMATAPLNESSAVPIIGVTAHDLAVSYAARIYSTILVIATILAHGALLTSFGLAVAVWVKRYGKAIGMSVAAFIVVTAIVPIVVAIAVDDSEHPGRDLACISPAVACAVLEQHLMSRMRYHRSLAGIPELCTFWMVEVLIVAIGLLWLTVRTFDTWFDRRPDYARSYSWNRVAIITLAAITGAGCCVGAIDLWIEGFDPGSSNPPLFSIVAASLMLAMGLMLIGMESARRGRPTLSDPLDIGSGISGWRFVRDRWWLSFRLVLLLAIGPALLALALATATRASRFEPQYTQTAAGNTSLSGYILIKNEKPYHGELEFGSRMKVTAILVATILVHGAAAISLGMGLATVRCWSPLTVSMAIAITASVVLVVPASYLWLNYNHPIVDYPWSVAVANHALLAVLINRASPNLSETTALIGAWDFGVATFAAVLSACTIRQWQRRALDAARVETSTVPQRGSCVV